MAMTEVNREERLNRVSVPEENNATQARGLRVAGYVIPWWVVIVVVALLAYLIYLCTSNNQTVGLVAPSTSPAVVTLQGGRLAPRLQTYGLETPAQVRELFGY